MDYRNKKFILKNGKTYIVIEQIDLDGHIYLYIVSKSNEEDLKIVEIKDDELIDVDYKLLEEKIMPLFIEKLRG